MVLGWAGGALNVWTLRPRWGQDQVVVVIARAEDSSSLPRVFSKGPLVLMLWDCWGSRRGDAHREAVQDILDRYYL